MTATHPAHPAGSGLGPPELELCWGTLVGTPVDELLAAAGAAGFAAVTATPAMVRQALASGVDLAHLMRSLGTRISQLDPLITPFPGVPSADEVGDGVRPLFEIGLDECLDLAAAAGAESVNLVHYLGDPSTDFVALCAAAEKVCDAAAARGVRVSLEFILENAIPDIQTAATMVAAVGAPNFGVLVDTLHLVRSGGTAAEVAALAPGTVGALQIADRLEPVPGAPYVPMTGRELPGEGVLPLAPIVSAALANARDTMPAGVEVFSAELRALGAAEAARRAADSVIRLLREAGSAG